MTGNRSNISQKLKNPFLYNARVPPEHFIGRKQEIALILDRLANPSNQGGSAISGPSGIGKTSLLQYIKSPYAIETAPELTQEKAYFAYISAYLMFPFSIVKFWHHLVLSLESWPANQCKQEVRKLLRELQEGPLLSSFPITNLFELIGKKKQLAVVLFDDFDQILEHIQSRTTGDVPNQERDEYLTFLGTVAALLNLSTPRGFSLIVASKQPVYDALAGSFSAFGSAFYTNMVSLPLRPFADAECEELLDKYLEGTDINFKAHERNALYRDSGGHPRDFQEAAFKLFEEKREQKDKTRAKRRKPRMGKLPLSSNDRSRLSSNDRPRLSDELNRIPNWADGGIVGEKSLLRDAGLPEGYVNRLPLSGTPTTDAPNVIAHLESLGHLANRPTHYALGALIEYLLDNTPSAEGKIFLAYLLNRYQLITNLDYLKALREKYGLLEVPASDDVVDLGWQTEQPTFSWEGPTDPDHLEAIWSKRASFLDAVFLEKGAKVARAVCRVEKADNFPLGTGFLIGPDLVLTNHHVLPTDEKAEAALVRFGYRVDHSGQLRQGEVYQVSHVLRRSSIQALDYVVLKLKEAPGENAEIGYLRPVARALQEGGSLYITQHPLGSPQKTVLQDNWITYVANDQRRVQYLTNTKRGSSGSPVGNEHWEIVALHHSGGPLPPSPEIEYIRGNEGIPMVAILPQIEDLLPT